VGDDAGVGSDAVVRDDPTPSVARLTLNRPERRNAISDELREALIAQLDAVFADDDIRAVVLTGAGRAFCSGGDISLAPVADPAAGRRRMQGHHEVVRQLSEAEKPLVAAVSGWAIGAGAGIALLCDSIVAGRSARLSFPFLRVGVVPDYGLAATLPARIGSGRARDLLLYGRTVDAATALEIGLVDEVVEDERVDQAALARAAELAGLPAHALALAKRLLSQVGSLEATLEFELMAQSLSYLTPERAEGRAAFLEKRKPSF
jgi:2-(1,2-epoxy-1,2-dihydrophenyl)acetyl-CoA isomerase